MTSPVRIAVIGVGGMARYHISRILGMQTTTRIVALCEPAEPALAWLPNYLSKPGCRRRPINRTGRS